VISANMLIRDIGLYIILYDSDWILNHRVNILVLLFCNLTFLFHLYLFIR